MKALHLRRERACTEHETAMLSLGELGHILVPLEQTGGEMERKVEARCWLTRRLTLDAYREPLQVFIQRNYITYLLQNQSCATVENKPLTTTIAQVIDKEGLDNGRNQAMLTFCLLFSTVSCFHLRNIFITHTHFYYLNSSTYSLFQLLASYFSCNYFKKHTLT